MWRKHTLAAVAIGIVVFGASAANADLMITVNGADPSGLPIFMEGIGPYTLAVEGNTPN